MPRFTVLPTDPAHSAIRFTARDAGRVLNVVGQLGCHEADVLEEGVYVFSVRLDASGVWAIDQRPDMPATASVTALG